ncbi:hypothetical protein HDV03_005520 [Kappamyces sp. JEL0829]|nr:hypothetical protein HDV03_005520 [Kappamyces sp. JEL0829]
MESFTLDTEYSADAVEFCPVPGWQEYFCIGTYQVDQEEGQDGSSRPYSRKGRLLLLQEHAPDKGFSLVQTLEGGAILDLKWSPAEALLASVTAKGDTILYALQPDGAGLVQHGIYQNASQALTLSVDWGRDSTTLATSGSDGSLSLLARSPAGLDCVSEWHAHDFEAWIACWDPADPHRLYSGGDDCKLKVWDTRTAGSVLVNKMHDAGVTTISRRPGDDYTIATGSYDEQVRLWDVRSLRTPHSALSTGGGVWRIRWAPKSDDNRLLVASMYNGFHILRAHPDQSLEMVQAYQAPHASIAYGADWSRASGRVGTCSFYDHLFSLWTPQT